MTETAALSRTPFHDFHLEHGAKMVPYAGWEMPMLYRSIRAEHEQVRTSGGIFDVSHMGRFRFKGRDAERFLDRVCTRQIHGMKDGMARYSLVCNHEGGCRDDVLIYRLGDADYMMVCNAANRSKLVDHFETVRENMVFKFSDDTEKTAMVAIQGPKAMELLSSFSSSIGELKRYRFVEKNLMIAKVMISRTGYTGEDGVEVIMPARLARTGLDLMLKNVDIIAPDPIVTPIGLGARDSLRLEASMALYGHEISETLDPVSAGLGFAIKLDKGDDNEDVPRFIGQDVLQRIAAEGPRRRLVGLTLEGRRSARQDMKVTKDGRDVGIVTSGCQSPTLDRCIAIAYVDAEHAEVGTNVEIDLGRTTAAAEVVDMPFYIRP